MRLLVILLVSTAVFQAQTTPDQWRGTNYVPNLAQSTSSATMMLDAGDPYMPGSYDSTIVAAEIARLQSAGVNSIRLLPSFYGWVINRSQYLANLDDLCQQCAAANISVVIQVWSAIGATEAAPSLDGATSPELWHELVGSSPTAVTNLEVYRGWDRRQTNFQRDRNSRGSLPPGEPGWATLLAEPGNELIAMSGDPFMWPYAMAARVEGYLNDLGSYFSSSAPGAAALAGFDLFNEPDAWPWIPIANYVEFIGFTYDRLVVACPSAQYCVGWARGDASVDGFDQMLVAAGVGRTYHSFHSYENPEVFRHEVIDRKAYADSQGLPLVVSEFHRTDWTAGVLRHLLDAVTDNGAGGQIWAVIQTNTFYTYHGRTHGIDGLYIPTPDGLSFAVNNPKDTAAFLEWTAGTLAPPPLLDAQIVGASAASVTQASPPAVAAGVSHDVSVTSALPGVPAIMRIAPMPTGAGCAASAQNCQIFPGIGWLPDPLGTATVFLGLTDVTGAVYAPGAFTPFGAPGQELVVTTYAGLYPVDDWNRNQGEITAARRYIVQ